MMAQLLRRFEPIFLLGGRGSSFVDSGVPVHNPAGAQALCWRGEINLFFADRRQKSAVGTAVLFQNLEAALLAQEPAERLRRIGVLKVEADRLAALERHVFPA